MTLLCRLSCLALRAPFSRSPRAAWLANMSALRIVGLAVVVGAFVLAMKQAYEIRLFAIQE